MMLIDLTDETAWTTEDGGTEYFTEVPFSHPGLPPGVLSVQVNCVKVPFSHADRAYAQHCLDNLPHRVENMITRLLTHIGRGDRSDFNIGNGAKSLVLFAGDTRTSVLGVLHADTGSSICGEWEDDKLVIIWGQDEGATEPAWTISESLKN